MAAAKINDNTYDTISEAINAALAGDIVNVQPGTWTEDLTITENITLMGPSGEVAQINGTININGSAALKQLKLVQTTNAQLVDATASTPANDSLVVEDCVLELSGTITDKTALYVKNYRGAGSSIKNNIINHNSASATGRRGVQLSEVSNVTMENNTIDMGVTDFTNPNTVYATSTYACQLVNSTIQNENINVSGNTLQNSFAALEVWSMHGADGLTFSNNTVSNVIRGLGLGIARVGEEEAPAGVFNNVQVHGNNFSGVALVAVSFGAISTGNAGIDTDYGVNDVLPLRNSNIVAPSLFKGDMEKVEETSTIDVSGTDLYKGKMPSEQIKELYLPADKASLLSSINLLYTAAGYTGFKFILPPKVYADLAENELSTHATIADAIEVAEAGHIVSVQKGVYDGDITITENITLMGPSGEVAQINGTININGSAGLKQLKLVQTTNAQLVDATASTPDNDSLVVEDCVLELSGNITDKTALYVKNYRGAGSSIKNNTINHNSASASGRRGVQLSEVSNVTMEGNTIDMGVTDFSDPNAVYSESLYACQLVNNTIQNENIIVSGNTLQNSFAALEVWSMNGADGLTFSNNTVSNVIRGLGLGIARIGGEQAPAGVFNNVQVHGNNFSGVALVAVSFGAISTGNAGNDTDYGVNDVLPLYKSNIVAPSLFVGDVAKVAANSRISVAGGDIYKGTMPTEQIKELYLPADKASLLSSINGLYTLAGYTDFEFIKIQKVVSLDLDQAAVDAVTQRYSSANLTSEEKTVVAKLTTLLEQGGASLSREGINIIAAAVTTDNLPEAAIEIIPSITVDSSSGPVVIDLVPKCALVVVDSEVNVVSPGQQTFIVPQQAPADGPPAVGGAFP
jgi:hypothetical protein